MRWVVAVLVALTGGWMLFDGIHALVTGDFVTPSSGEYAGELGPWTVFPKAIGVEPRSFGVKVFFVVFGALYLASLVAFLLNGRSARLLLAAAATVALLYLPFGTLTSIIVLVIVIRLR